MLVVCERDPNACTSRQQFAKELEYQEWNFVKWTKWFEDEIFLSWSAMMKMKYFITMS